MKTLYCLSDIHACSAARMHRSRVNGLCRNASVWDRSRRRTRSSAGDVSESWSTHGLAWEQASRRERGRGTGVSGRAIGHCRARINGCSAYAKWGRGSGGGLVETSAARTMGAPGCRSRRLVRALKRAVIWRGGGPRERQSLALVGVR